MKYVVSLSGGVSSALAVKYCARCNQSKPVSEFNKCSSRYDGLQGYCRLCKKQMYVENAPADRERRHDYYQGRAGELRAKQQRWRDANKERHCQYSRQWFRANPGKHRANVERRLGRIIAAGEAFDRIQWVALCNKFDWTCLCCGLKEPEIVLTPDHVIPLSRGGGNDISNIQPLCLYCNKKKHTKHVDYRPEVVL